MNTQGKLYQKIEELKPELWIPEDMPKIAEILNTAKTEFPKGSFYNKKGDTIILNTETVKRIQEINDWFERWFGSSTP